MQRNALIYACSLACLLLVGLLLLGLLPDLSVGGRALRRVDILADVRVLPPRHTGETDGPGSAHTADSTLIVADSLAAQGPDTLARVLELRRHRQDSLLAIAWANRAWELDTTGLIGIEDYSDSTMRGMVAFYRALDRLQTEGRPVRIAYFGDSFVEGDILTADLREKLQRQFGGRGVGFVPVTSIVSRYRPTVTHDFHDWVSHSVMDAAGTFDPTLLGLSGHYFVPQGPGAYVQLQGVSRYARLDTCQRASIIFRNRGMLTLSVQVNGSQTRQTRTFGPADSLQTMTVEGRIGAVRWTVEQADSALFYGLTMDDPAGVAVDNFGLRSNSGLKFLQVPEQTMREFCRLRPYDLIVLQYGINVANEDQVNYKGYINGMRHVIRRLKDNFPDAAILVVGVSDRDTRTEDGDLRTMPGIKPLMQSQQDLAREEAVAFWNLFRAMGGEESMLRFAHAEPAMANHDYIHINFRGGRHIAQSLFDAIMQGKQQFDQWRREHEE